MTQIRMILLDSAPVLALGVETYARASPENQGAWKYQSFYVKDIFANMYLEKHHKNCEWCPSWLPNLIISWIFIGFSVLIIKLAVATRHKRVLFTLEGATDWNDLFSTALQCSEEAEIKSQPLTHGLTEWQGHLLSCLEQLKNSLTEWQGHLLSCFDR